MIEHRFVTNSIRVRHANLADIHFKRAEMPMFKLVNCRCEQCLFWSDENKRKFFVASIAWWTTARPKRCGRREPGFVQLEFHDLLWETNPKERINLIGEWRVTQFPGGLKAFA